MLTLIAALGALLQVVLELGSSQSFKIYSDLYQKLQAARLSASKIIFSSFLNFQWEIKILLPSLRFSLKIAMRLCLYLSFCRSFSKVFRCWLGVTDRNRRRFISKSKIQTGVLKSLDFFRFFATSELSLFLRENYKLFIFAWFIFKKCQFSNRKTLNSWKCRFPIWKVTTFLKKFAKNQKLLVFQ